MSTENIGISPTSDVKVDVDNEDDGAVCSRDALSGLILNYFVTGKQWWSTSYCSFQSNLIDVCFYSISVGFQEAAEKFKEESGLECEIDFRTLEERVKIRDAVQTGKILEATSLIHEQHPELLDDDKSLHFQLQVTVECKCHDQGWTSYLLSNFI